MMPIQDEQTDAGDELSRSKGTKQALEEQITGLKSDLDAVQTGDTNPNEVGAVDRFLERAKFRRTVQPSRDNPRGIERVLLKENQAAAFGMMLGLARRFVWSGEQRGQIVAAMQEKKAGAGEAGEKVAAKDAA